MRYQDIYPEDPLLNSEDLKKPSARSMLTLEFFEAEPSTMPHEVFAQHHILINLKEEPHRVEHWRDDEHRDFIYHKNEIIVTPAGVRSGWRWHARSKVIVITLEPEQLEKFAQTELGVLLKDEQLKNIPPFIDEDITSAGILLRDALQSDMGSDVLFESYARIFLVKLILKYGLERDEDLAFNQSFTAKHYKRILDYVAEHYAGEVSLEQLARQAGLSTSHFSRLFKQTIGQSPYQFVMAYRVEQAKKMLQDPDRPMIDIALSCGFSDQAHFARTFKQSTGETPGQFRKRH